MRCLNSTRCAVWTCLVHSLLTASESRQGSTGGALCTVSQETLEVIGCSGVLKMESPKGCRKTHHPIFPLGSLAFNQHPLENADLGLRLWCIRLHDEVLHGVKGIKAQGFGILQKINEHLPSCLKAV